MKGQAFEADVFHATTGLAISASLARTLAHCVFWSQYATHLDEGMPSIWKTGPELQRHLRICPRTANRHLKELAKLGYWKITYRPRPGTIGPVTWLTMTERASHLLDLASSIATNRKASKVKIETAKGHKATSPMAPLCDDYLAQNVTSKQIDHSVETATKTASFILPSEAGKQGMNEAPTSSSPEEKCKGTPKAPGYANASAADRQFASIVETAWSDAGVKTWDWSSLYTWRHTAEIRRKLATVGVSTVADMFSFVSTLLENWSWLRVCIAPRYAHHPTNLHAPSPMALAHEFNLISEKVLEKIDASNSQPKASIFDEEF